MSTREHFLARLLDLPRIGDQEVRRKAFRQSIVALGMAEQTGVPLALAGVDPNALARSMQMAWADGLLEDLKFIAPEAAAAALYQLMSALPLGSERRAVGRKVLMYLYKGNARTFASLAARMAMGSTRPLRGAGIRARVALSLNLRSSAEGSVDRLALAFVTRRELARDWINLNATGALPERRLAARLLERAAREAARRAEVGDSHPLQIFRSIVAPQKADRPSRPDGSDAIGAAWSSLLADRETLVWRHLAVARGLLSHQIPQYVKEARALLSPTLSPTEWRRGATSLVARVAVKPDQGLSEVMEFLGGPLLQRDPGIATAMVWGLTPVAEVEPEAAEELLDAIANLSPISIADSVVELRQLVPEFGDGAAEVCAGALRDSLEQPEVDESLSALAHGILTDLESSGEQQRLRRAVRKALEAFGEEGSMQALQLAKEAQEIAAERVSQLEGVSLGGHGQADSRDARRKAMALLRGIDTTLLESRTLTDLLLLERPPGSEASGVESMDDLDSRMVQWLLDNRRAGEPLDGSGGQLTLLQRQLRLLLHLIDGGATDFGDDQERRLQVRARWALVIRLFVDQLRKEPNSRMSRALLATVARAFDALVRDGAAEAVDVFLFTAMRFSDASHITVVAEASMQPDVVRLLRHYLTFLNTAVEGNAVEQVQARIAAFKRFLHAFPSQTTLRSEAFRTTAWTLAHALGSIMTASSLEMLVPRQSTAADVGPLAVLDDGLAQLHQLVVGAERRCTEEVRSGAVNFPERHSLAHALESAVNTSSDAGLGDALNATSAVASSALPEPLGQLVTKSLAHLSSLQISRSSMQPIPLVNQKRAKLPEWLPARRTLGGFYVLRQLGGGNVGTVFVVKRSEERHDKDAELFALKVPEYDATAARTMSEHEFLELFRQEAGALLAIPRHANIAHFVTFDAGAKPKPLLVMELIEGNSCERILNSQSLDIERATMVLEGVMAGLEAMHAIGIGHLDVKPSNVIVRDSGDAVLVDFGLAGRRVRPGCATLCYGAPEVWETAPGEPSTSSAAATDVYAFGCFAYEVMTGHTLFDGDTDVAIISAHITHDGTPDEVAAMGDKGPFKALAVFLSQCLRYRPEDRATMTELREAFRNISPELRGQSWPLKVGRAS